MAKKQARSSANQGIQAGRFRAEVVAVGPGARATQVRVDARSQQSVERALSEIRELVQGLEATPRVRAQLDKEVASLEQAARAQPPEPKRAETAMARLSVLVDTLDKGAGVIEKLKRPAQLLGKVIGASLALL